MVFSSIEFLWFFMPVVLALYLALPPRARNALLVGVSLVFYAWGAQSLVLLFLASIAVNYAAGLLIAREQARRASTAAPGPRRGRRRPEPRVPAVLEVRRVRRPPARVAGGRDRAGSIGTPHILLPSGISFFTFHGISYVVDVHRGTSRPMRRVADYGQYMAFFPQLIAGPDRPLPRDRRPDPRAAAALAAARRHRRGLPALRARASPRRSSSPTRWRRSPPRRSTAPRTRTSPRAWLGALAYTVQIYFDFSGYTRHGDRDGADVRPPLPRELRPARTRRSR